MGKNPTDTNYFEHLLPGGWNVGHYDGLLGDPRAHRITIRQVFN